MSTAAGDVFVLDTSVLIQAKDAYYALDIAPGFWKGIITLAGSGSICITDELVREISERDDELSNWLKKELKPRIRICNTKTQTCQGCYDRVVQWVEDKEDAKGGNYTRYWIDDFMRGADPSLIAYASVNGHRIASNEAPKPNGNKPKIPDVGVPFGVESFHTYKMMRQLGFTLN